VRPVDNRTAPDLPAAYRELSAMVGTCGPRVHGTVLARDIERFAIASGDEPPDTSRADRRIVAPPLMLTSTIQWGAGLRLDDLHVDGTGLGREGWLPLAGLRLMGGGQDLHFHHDVLSDESFTADPMLADVELKDGGSGPFLLLTFTTVFRGAGGAELVTCRETLIAR
jgi:hypothetical protein